MRSNPTRCGFTLIELLVVIAVLVLLLAILLPSLAKSKELTRRVVCASNQRQITLGMILYAEDHDGYLANFTMAHGPNVHDVDKRFVEMMENRYHIKEEFFFCPSTRRDNIQWRMNFNKTSTDAYILGYYFWVPRYNLHYDSQIPPPQSTGTLVVADTTPYWGPEKTTDPLALTNPLITDEVASIEGAPPDANLGKEYSLVHPLSCHQWRNKLEMINQAFMDGRVQPKKAVALKARYGYNSGANGWLYR